MKRTTYIMIGMFLGCLLLAIAFLVYFRMTVFSFNEQNYKLVFSEKATEIDLSDVHTISFSTTISEHENYYFIETGKVGVSPSSDGSERLTYPDSDYIKIDKQDGVLNVTVDLSSAHQHITAHEVGNGIFLYNLNLLVEPGMGIKEIRSDRAFEVLLTKLAHDTLSLYVDKAQMDSCSIDRLKLSGKGAYIECQDLQINKLYLDLDEVSRANVKNCHVETLYLTAGKRSQYDMLPSLQYKKLIWEPRNNDTALNLRLENKAEVLLQE